MFASTFIRRVSREGNLERALVRRLEVCCDCDCDLPFTALIEPPDCRTAIAFTSSPTQQGVSSTTEKGGRRG